MSSLEELRKRGVELLESNVNLQQRQYELANERNALLEDRKKLLIERDVLASRCHELSLLVDELLDKENSLITDLRDLRTQVDTLQQASNKKLSENENLLNKSHNHALRSLSQILRLHTTAQASDKWKSLVCRNCESSRVIAVDRAGKLAPFFAARVLGVKSGQLAHLEVDAALCLDCLFLTHATKLPEDGISRLYEDYRQESYNEERISYEPEYAEIAAKVGGPDELVLRSRDLGEYFQGLLSDRVLELMNVRSALDWGGGTGEYIPFQILEHCEEVVVHDISTGSAKGGQNGDMVSTNTVKESVPLIDVEARYDYIQFCHVLEHLQEPLASVRSVVERHLNPFGYLYVEVPIEEDMYAFAPQLAAIPGHSYLVHEHINKYCLDSVFRLAESIGRLSILDLREDTTNVGWALPGLSEGGRVKIIRCLCQKH